MGLHNQKDTQKARSNDLKLNLRLKDSLIKRVLNYKETFSPILNRDSFTIIMAFEARFRLEPHQMVKIAFLIENLEKQVEMNNLKGM